MKKKANYKVKLNEQQRGQLYRAVHGPLMDVRIKLLKDVQLPDQQSRAIAQAADTIWRRLCFLLDLE